MKNIQAIKVGNTVNVSLDGRLIKKSFETAEKAKDFFSLVNQWKQNPTDVDLQNEFYKIMDDDLRVAYLAGLEHNKRTGDVFLAGFSTPLPKSLLEVIEEYHENKYPLDAIINFWKLLMVNPDKRVRENAFDFISKHDFVLTDMGYMIVYKAVYFKSNYDGSKNDLNEDEAFDKFIREQYLHVKNDWKCSGNKYIVYRHVNSGKLAITKKETAEKWDEEEKGVTIVGKLGNLYEQIIKAENAFEEEEVLYTDMYSRSMTIKVGEPVYMPRRECDANPMRDCSYGLHVGATKYVESFARSSSAILVCLVNPANIVAVPNYNHSKMRVSEYFPFATAKYENGEIEIIDQAYFESDYVEHEIETLEKQIAKVKAEELPIEKAINGGGDESRPMSELMLMLESRLIDIE